MEEEEEAEGLVLLSPGCGVAEAAQVEGEAGQAGTLRVTSWSI